MVEAVDSLGADLALLLFGLSDRAASLTELAALKQQLGPGREKELEVIALQVQDCEAKVAQWRAELSQQTEELTALRALKEEALQTGARLKAIQAAAPAHLPGDQQVANSKTCDTPRQQQSRPPLGELLPVGPTALPAAPALNAAAGGGGGPPHHRCKPSRQQPPVLAYVNEAELASAPQYMRSRLSLEKLNNAVQEVQMMLNDKYALLSTPSSQLRALSERDRKQHGAYKELQTDQTKGLFFLSELDLKNSMLLKQGDATGKNILAVLRHVGRLREFKHGGHRCWHTR